MSENTTKALSSPLPSDEQHEAPSPTIQEKDKTNTLKNTVITITFPVIKEHKITIEGISDLNNDGVIDIKDVLIAIKQHMEKSNFGDI